MGLIQAVSFSNEVMEKDYSETKQCRMVKGKQKFFDVKCAFVLRKASPLTTVLDRK